MTNMLKGALAALALTTLSPAALAGSGPHCTASAQECIDQITKSLAGRGWLGVELEPAPTGMAVTKVVEGSPAEKAGLKAGDVLVSVDGKSYLSKEEKDHLAIRSLFAPGKTVTFVTERAGRTQDVKVELAPMPEQVRMQILGGHMMEHSAEAQAARASLRELSVEEVAAMMKDGRAVLVDANGSEVRQKWGVIPGATLLTSSSSYDAKELPSAKDKVLVFYCANTKCTASDSAAKLAKEHGYRVAVLRAGIMGWKDAGQKTTTPST
jgi:rhodanese-related sulfurtransferase